jgi:hypothetical protein
MSKMACHTIWLGRLLSGERAQQTVKLLGTVSCFLRQKKQKKINVARDIQRSSNTSIRIFLMDSI